MVNHDNQEEDIDKLGDLENMEEFLQSLWQDLGFQCCTRCPKKNSSSSSAVAAGYCTIFLGHLVDFKSYLHNCGHL